MSLYQDIVEKKAKLSLVGLGYVGMPIAVAFAKKVNVIGYDLNQEKIDGVSCLLQLLLLHRHSEFHDQRN